MRGQGRGVVVGGVGVFMRGQGRGVGVFMRGQGRGVVVGCVCVYEGSR